MDPTPKRICRAEVSGRILADCGGWIPPRSEFMKPKYSRGIRLCCALTNWSPPTRRTTLPVLGPDGFAAGKNSALLFGSIHTIALLVKRRSTHIPASRAIKKYKKQCLELKCGDLASFGQLLKFKAPIVIGGAHACVLA